MTRTTPAGDRVVLLTADDQLLLDGDGATPKGARPFLDLVPLHGGAKKRLFQSGDDVHEQVVGVLDERGARILVTRESRSEPPNWFVVDLVKNERRAITKFEDPAARLTAGIQKQLVSYERKDGVKLSATLYLPPGYKAGAGRLPLLVWAYPREYVDAGTASQVRASPNRYTRLSGISHLFVLLCGYAVLDVNADELIVTFRSPETVLERDRPTRDLARFRLRHGSLTPERLPV